MNTDHQQSKNSTAALYCLFGDITWLPQSFASIYPCVGRIFFFLSTEPWYGESRAGRINPHVVQALPDPEGKVRVITGAWNSEVEQRNVSLAYAQLDGFTHGLIIDADEIYDTTQLHAAISYASERKAVAVWHVNWFTYWKSPRHRIDPVEPYQPPILVTLGEAGFEETRNALGAAHDLIPPNICMCHHLSYVLTEDALRAKHIMQSGHSQSAYPGWYEEKWLGWDLDHSIHDLHPVNPPWFKRTVEQPIELLPAVLR